MKFNKLLLALGLAPLAAWAEPNVPEIITVTAFPMSLDEVLASAEVISQDELQSTAATDLADILRFHSGIEIGRNGGPGQQTSVFIRGAESDHTLIMIDGVPINSGSVGLGAIQNISPQAIERVEVVKGPQSVLWGSGAIGGVINVITRKARGQGLSYGGMLEVGSDSTVQTGAHIAQASDKLALDASLYYQQTDGMPTMAASSIDSGYDNLTGNLGLVLDAGDSSITARHWQTQGNTEYLDYFLNPLDQDFLNSASRLGWSMPLADAWQTGLDLSYVRDFIEQNQSDEAVRTRRTELKWQNQIKLDGQSNLVAGANVDREKVESEGGWSPYDEQTDYWEAFGQYDTWLAAGHHLNLGGRYLDHDTAGSHFTWNLGYGIDLTDSTRLSANAATGFKIPTANERFGYGGNPDLKPEESTSYELTLRHQLDQAQSINLALFRNDIDNLIQWVLVNPPWEGYNQNIAETRIEGVELGYNLSSGGWSLDLGATWQDPQDLTTDSQLLRRAKFNFDTRLSYAWDGLTIGSSLLYSGERKDFGGVTLDPYWLVNLDATYSLDSNWSIYTKVENLLDEDYELASGYNTPGLAAYVGIRYQ